MATSRSRLTFSYEGLGTFLRSGSMEADMRVIAERAMSNAVETGPVGDPRTDRHSGRYVSSFSVESGRDGGFSGNRAYASLVNDSEEAHMIEWGNRNITGRHTMLEAMRRAAAS